MADLLERLRASLRDRYEVDRDVGQGGMAVVYLARDVKHDRSVAIKVLLPDLAASVGHERFLREIEIAAKLQHPNILPVYDSGEADGLLYYVMPYVAGESLRDRIRRQGAFDADDALQITREVAGALDYAHTEGIIHRDIKPANILLSQGHAQVADFGIARALSASAGEGLTQVGMAIGTPEYMAPEQALGDSEIDGRVDVYALGCVLYEMLAGEPPFQGKTPQSIVAQSISGAIPKLQDDTRGLQAVIEKAMAKEPGHRYQRAGDLEVALRTSASPIAVPQRSTRLMAVAGATVVLLAIAGFALWPRGWRVDGDPRKSLVIFPFENKTGDPGRDYLQEASMNLLGLAVAHWEDIRVYDDERTGSLLRRRGVERPADIDFDAAQNMAREARVGTLVLGDIRRDGDSLAIEAKVHDTRTGERIATEIVRAGFEADPRPVFDTLAARLLQVSGAPPGERPELVSQTTHSLEAYRSYLAGVEALQRFDIDSSRSSFQRAVQLDSTFALAYIGLRNVEGWAGIDGSEIQRGRWVARAQAYSASLPPRLRTLVQYYAAYENGDLVRARDLARQLIERDSSDVEAWYQLGEAHFHDNPRQFPHHDSLGNIGTALRVFQRVLSLNPRYTLAYRHTLDALGNCSANAPWVCLADSAVYASREELAEQFGQARLEQLRQEASDARLETARAWVDATPGSPRPRFFLLELLVERELLSEARRHIAALRESNPPTAARIWEAQLLLHEGNYAGAADTMTAALEDFQGSMQFLLSGSDGPEPAFAALMGGARVTKLAEFAESVGAIIAGAAAGAGQATTVGPGGVQYPLQLLVRMIRFATIVELDLDSQSVNREAAAWLDTLDVVFARDSSSRERAIAYTAGMVIGAQLSSRDTTLLVRLLQAIDTTGTRTWRVADAYLALARGDSARARLRVDRHVRNADDLEFMGEPGAGRAFLWADLLARLGDYEEAIEVYGYLDAADLRAEHPGLHVRSFAERAALSQQLGATDQAIEFYERFIAAWERGDEAVQPLVQRARDAIAALRGETRPVEGR